MLVGGEDAFAGGVFEAHGVAGGDEIAGIDDAFVDEGEDGGFGDEGAEFFHEVEGEGGLAEAGLVEKADVGIEADSVGGEDAIFGEEAVEEGEEGVDGIAGGAAVALAEVEGEGLLAVGGGVGFFVAGAFEHA